MYLVVDETSVLLPNMLAVRLQNEAPSSSRHPPSDAYLSGVLVGKVQGVVGKLDAAIAVALGQEAVVVA